LQKEESFGGEFGLTVKIGESSHQRYSVQEKYPLEGKIATPLLSARRRSPRGFLPGTLGSFEGGWSGERGEKVEDRIQCGYREAPGAENRNTGRGRIEGL